MESLKVLTDPELIKLVLKFKSEISTNQTDIELQNKKKDLEKDSTVIISKTELNEGLIIYDNDIFTITFLESHFDVNIQLLNFSLNEIENFNFFDKNKNVLRKLIDY